MSWIKTGRVEVSCLFLLLCAWLVYRDTSTVVLQGLLACLLHEMGHYAALLQINNSVKQIRITVFGAKLMPEKSMNYDEELFVAATGPGVNLALAYLFCKIPEGDAFAGMNLALGVFNLLPIGELDGSRMLRCLLSLAISPERAAEISRYLDFCFTASFVVLGLFLAIQSHNLTMLLMSLWLLKRSVQKKTMSI